MLEILFTKLKKKKRECTSFVEATTKQEGVCYDKKSLQTLTLQQDPSAINLATLFPSLCTKANSKQQ